MKKNALSFVILSACIAGPIGLSAQKITSAPAAAGSNKQQKIAEKKEPVSSAVSLNQPLTKKFIDLANFDLSVKPGDNFYLYSNGTWIKNTPIPGSKTRWGSFDALAEESSLALKGLLENAAKAPGDNSLMKRVGDFYTSAMDSMAIERLGYTPLKEYLDGITALS